MLSWDEFSKVELVVAEIKEVKEHPNADRLYLLTVDLGTEERQLVAGIRAAYDKEDLLGKKVVVVANLQPAVIRGEESRGMILAASDGDRLAIVTPEKEVRAGARVK